MEQFELTIEGGEVPGGGGLSPKDGWVILDKEVDHHECCANCWGTTKQNGWVVGD